jgi:6-phosphogluconolactonase
MMAPEVRILPDRESLSRVAAEVFAEEAQRSATKKDRFDVLLSGGETPSSTYQLLAEEPFRSSVPWEKVHFFWGDERYVPHDDPRSNFDMARRTLLQHLPLDASQIHPVPFLPTPQHSALQYENELKAHFPAGAPRFDLVFLGLGDDGHTASLFPGTPAVKERKRWVLEVSPTGQELHRVTVTVPVLNQAGLVVFLVSGAGKAEIVRQVLEGEPRPHRLPAQLIHPVHGRLLWLIDRDAARQLSR